MIKIGKTIINCIVSDGSSEYDTGSRKSPTKPGKYRYTPAIDRVTLTNQVQERSRSNGAAKDNTKHTISINIFQKGKSTQRMYTWRLKLGNLDLIARQLR